MEADDQNLHSFNTPFVGYDDDFVCNGDDICHFWIESSEVAALLPFLWNPHIYVHSASAVECIG